MKQTISRIATTATLVVAGLALAACGTSAAAGGTAKASPSPSPRVRNGAQGELVQMNGSTLILNASSGDVTVLYDASTTFQKTSTGTFQDITANKCIVATGARDPGGNVTAATVRLSDRVNGACAFGQGPAGGGVGGARATPLPGASPRPNLGNLAFTGGEVTAVSGTTVTVQPPTGAAQTVIVATTVRVSRSSLASASDLALHQCLSATGTRDASGKVTARAIAIVPAGPTGCFTGGGGGFGGFGGFGRGPGGGGGGGGGAPGD